MGRIITLLASLALMAASGIVLQLSWEAFRESKPAVAQSQESSCPGGSGQVILSESGGDVSRNARGYANYGPFTTSTD